MLKCSNSGGKGIQRPLIETADNDSLRLAVERGSSTNLGHLRKTAEVNFNFLTVTQIPLGRVDTSENDADISTKTLSSTKLQYRLSPWYMSGASRNDNSQAVLNVEFHRHCVTCANCNFVDTGHVLSVVCSCRMSQAFAFSVLLSCMRIAEARVEIASAILLVEINMTQCFSLVAAGVFRVFIMCWSPRRCVGAFEESQKEKLKVKTTKRLGTTLEQSVRTILPVESRVVRCQSRSPSIVFSTRHLHEVPLERKLLRSP